MHVLRHFENVPPVDQGAVLALGNFDGVHRGHQAVIAEARAIAEELGVPLGVVVFEPHPRQYFFPDQPFFRLTPFRAKARLLEALGVDVLFALPFDRAMSQMLAQDFVTKVLIEGMRAVHIVVGYDFRFGKGRGGDVSVLRHMGEMEGYGVTVVEEIRTNKTPETISSSRIREALEAGEPQVAARLLGHYWAVEARVLSGDQRGRTIGFPTLNLALDEHIEPRLGVYAVRVEVEDGPHKGNYEGVANVGRRPTFDKQDVLLEVHLFDFEGDLYGAHVRTSLVEFIRPEQKFDGLDSLKAQIALDSAEARRILKEVPDKPLIHDGAAA